MASGLSAFISRIGAISGTLMIGYLIDDYCTLVIVIVAAQLFCTYTNFTSPVFFLLFFYQTYRYLDVDAMCDFIYRVGTAIALLTLVRRQLKVILIYMILIHVYIFKFSMAVNISDNYSILLNEMISFYLQ